MIKEILVINGCVSLMLAGLYVSYQLNSKWIGLAYVCVGIANLIFMLR
jgi:hypothetical protein